MKYGIENEENASISYAESTRLNVYPCGIIINQVNEGLGLHFFLEKSRWGGGGGIVFT